MNNRPRILLTGATGFVGLRYIEYNKKKYDIQCVSLRSTKVSDIDFSGVDSIVHLAGMAHQMKKVEDKLYFDVNYKLTRELADFAKETGVRHFVFVSTIKVFGEHHRGVLNEDTRCEPINDPYGASKLKAEKYLESIANDSFKVALVRPPLIYGPRVKGNLIRFLRLADSNYFLPFGKINNRRTMIFIDNFVSLLNRIVDTKATGIVLAGDDQPISTTKLISLMRGNMGRKNRLVKVPKIFVKVLGMVRPELAIRLYRDLEMDTSVSYNNLSFSPPYTIEEGVNSMVGWYLEEKNKTK